jgi:hypothetical protein
MCAVGDFDPDAGIWDGSLPQQDSGELSALLEAAIVSGTVRRRLATDTGARVTLEDLAAELDVTLDAAPGFASDAAPDADAPEATAR